MGPRAATLTCLSRTKALLVQQEGAEGVNVLLKGSACVLAIGDEVVVMDRAALAGAAPPGELPEDAALAFMLAEAPPGSAAAAAAAAAGGHGAGGAAPSSSQQLAPSAAAAAAAAAATGAGATGIGTLVKAEPGLAAAGSADAPFAPPPPALAALVAAPQAAPSLAAASHGDCPPALQALPAAGRGTESTDAAADATEARSPAPGTKAIGDGGADDTDVQQGMDSGDLNTAAQGPSAAPLVPVLPVQPPHATPPQATSPVRSGGVPPATPASGAKRVAPPGDEELPPAVRVKTDPDATDGAGTGGEGGRAGGGGAKPPPLDPLQEVPAQCAAVASELRAVLFGGGEAPTGAGPSDASTSSGAGSLPPKSRMAGPEMSRLWDKELRELEAGSAGMPRVIIGVVGDTGSGKSSLLNALLGEDNILPTNGMRACTASVIEVSYAATGRYVAEIEFVSREEFDQLLTQALEDLKA
ncbi:hypothetical protein MNEG_1856 [Monoraphidium neglectum]|uniref:Dynamin N-terminal domain-containing protein n=1 Tax=Monoraphidium neglectum TaxID=145388 RepID=A0A0D2NNQ6_9CHLO|nr:hypothetical protein MNEG_1856 [Monoraphidium neglectum]KIZ06101.1 hypothetical protein MNEG_1856 [Monoraphidium neglectum]|eukprot:XP_013905120.1 hypothetical protein MNEG_1856 [Monoraphidium neglectum]